MIANAKDKPTLANRLGNFLGFGRFIAGEAGNKRRDPGTSIRTSDELLTDTKRRRVIEGGRELQRNFAIAAWAIRKHLDYVSTFTFQAMTGDEALNEYLEGFVEEYSRPVNCHSAGRHSFRKIVRLAEARRVIDGDLFLVKLARGQVQPIEGDRVRDPKDQADGERWVHGCDCTPGGAIRKIAVHARGKYGRYDFERTVRKRNFLHLGYFDAFDQIRGVSPLASAIADFQDVLEVRDYAKAKAKITQLFALAITREFDDETAGEGIYDVDFSQGAVKMEMDPGDKAEFLESKHPSTEFQAFLQVCLQGALKALDIPWSFADEAYTNFFGSRAALIQYQQSCRDKRADLKEFLNSWIGWRFNLAFANGDLVLPAGVAPSALRWDWIPAGVPWWDPAKEVRGDLAAVEGGLRTLTEIRRERYGDDWKKNVIDKRASELAYMREKLGVINKAGEELTLPVPGFED